MAASALIPLVIVIVVVGIIAAVGFVAYGIAQGVGNTTREKMEKKNLVFSKEGMKVGVKEVSEEAEKDRSQSILVNMWNHTSFPAYKSRLWNMAGSSEDQDSVGKRKPHLK